MCRQRQVHRTTASPIRLVVFFYFTLVFFSFSSCVSSASVIQAPPVTASVYLEIADGYMGIKQYDKAVRYYTIALDLEPGWNDLAFNLATALVQEKKYGQALDLLEKLHTYDQDNLMVSELLALSYGMNGQTDEALVRYRELMAQNGPQYSLVHNAVLLSQRALKDPDEELLTFVELYRAEKPALVALVVQWLLDAEERKAILPLKADLLLYTSLLLEQPDLESNLLNQLLDHAIKKDDEELSITVQRYMYRKDSKDLSSGFAVAAYDWVHDYAKGVASMKIILEAGYKDEVAFAKFQKTLDAESVRVFLSLLEDAKSLKQKTEVNEVSKDLEQAKNNKNQTLGQFGDQVRRVPGQLGGSQVE